MDKIQKILIEACHKDLAQEYYKKVAVSQKVAGTWALPDSPSKIEKLDKFMNGLENLNELYPILGEDELWDELGVLSKKMRKAIVKSLLQFISHYEKEPDDFKKKLDIKALKKLTEKWSG